jgi:serine/threonine protein kinase
MQVGEIVEERYRLEEALGTDVPSQIFRATDTESAEKCLLKVRPATDEDVDCIDREAAAFKALHHPQIPALQQTFSTQLGDVEYRCLVRDYVEGRTLAEEMADGRRFTEAEALQIIIDLDDVLTYLHTLSPPVVHRDLKPDNIVRDPQGKLHLIDFNPPPPAATTALAPIEAETAVGTFGYVPREQYAGEAVPASDVYSLGVTLVHLLTREEPWQMGTAGVRLNFGHLVELSDPSQRLLEKMVEPELADRYPTLTAMKTDLEPARHGYTPSTVRSSSSMILLSMVAVPVGVGVVILGVIIGLLLLIIL